jgi:hypothetical protein
VGEKYTPVSEIMKTIIAKTHQQYRPSQNLTNHPVVDQSGTGLRFLGTPFDEMEKPA